MIVITLTDCPISLRGDLSKWLVEINTGVFVGKVSARVRENLWRRVISNVKNGKATLVYNTNNEQRMDFRIHNSENEIIDFDGLKLVLKPSPSRTKNLIGRRLGFSKASKIRFSQKRQNAGIISNEGKTSYPMNYVILDLETSGLDPTTNEIIEIGMLKVYKNEVVDVFSTLVKPEVPISELIVNLTGITNEELEEKGQLIEDVLPVVKEFLGDSIVVGHYLRFDYSFLNTDLAKCNLSIIKNRSIDTMDLYSRFLEGKKASKKLLDIAARFEIPVEKQHRSLADCIVVKKVYDVLKVILKK